MKTFMIAAVVTFGMVGCASHNRCNMCNNKPTVHRTDAHHRNFDRSDMKRRERPDTANHRQRGEGVERDGMRERYAEAGRRLRIAVEEGKLTKEEAKEKFEALRKRDSRKAK